MKYKEPMTEKCRYNKNYRIIIMTALYTTKINLSTHFTVPSPRRLKFDEYSLSAGNLIIVFGS